MYDFYMLDVTTAKKTFRQTLALLLVTIFWPIVMGLFLIIAAIISEQSVTAVSAIFSIAWLVLFVWLIVKLWKIGPQVGVSSWGALWLLFPVLGIFIVGMLFLEPLKYIADKSNLPLTWNLIKDTWHEFNKYLKPSINSAMWLLYGSLILGAVMLLSAIWPIFYALYAIAAAGYIALTLWVSMKIFLAMYNLDTDGKVKGDEGKISLKNFWSMIWIAILTILIVAGPVVLAYLIYTVGVLVSGMGMFSTLSALGTDTQSASTALAMLANVGLGLLLLVILVVLMIGGCIWIMYKSNQYKLTMPALLLQGKKGMPALNESARLIKNRWWGFFWKNMMIGLTAGALLAIVLQIVIGIILAILLALLPKGAVGNGVGGFLTMAGQGAMQIILVPFLLLFEVKLYKAFVKTAK